MNSRRVRLCAGTIVSGILFAFLLVLSIRQPLSGGRAADTLPGSLTDEEFWSLSERISEPDGFFRSNSGSRDNLLSNENTVSTVAAELAGRMTAPGVYLGVGPEQNFTYIAAMRPRIAFITDIRRGNLHLHLMYKAIFEMSPARVDFVGRLFNRKRPTSLTSTSTASELMNAYFRTNPDNEAAFKANLKAILDLLTKTHGFRLDEDDLAGIEYVYRNFYKFGPELHYTSSIGGRTGVSYGALMSSRDSATGGERSYLASENNFAVIKSLQSRNLIVPIVGDFAGPKALRAVGGFLREHGATLTAFYVSNVEDYLQRNGVWPQFCANVGGMPINTMSIFIRPNGGRNASFVLIAQETARCAKR